MPSFTASLHVSVFNRGSASAGVAARLRVCGLFILLTLPEKRDGMRDRAGKVTRVDKGNFSACEMEDGQLAFLLNYNSVSFFVRDAGKRILRHSDVMRALCFDALSIGASFDSVAALLK